MILFHLFCVFTFWNQIDSKTQFVLLVYLHKNKAFLFFVEIINFFQQESLFVFINENWASQFLLTLAMGHY